MATADSIMSPMYTEFIGGNKCLGISGNIFYAKRLQNSGLVGCSSFMSYQPIVVIVGQWIIKKYNSNQWIKK